MMSFILLDPSLSIMMSASDDLFRAQDAQGDLNPFGRAEPFGVPCPDLLVWFLLDLRLGEGENPQGILE